MTLPNSEIIRALPGLRRYACALTGSTRSGDAYIRVALEALVEEPWRLPPESEVKPELYGLFHRALQICNFQKLSNQAPEAHSDLHQRLLQLSLSLAGVVQCQAELRSIPARGKVVRLNHQRNIQKPQSLLQCGGALRRRQTLCILANQAGARIGEGRL